MSAADALESGRAAFARGSWGAAFGRLSEADGADTPGAGGAPGLGPADLERLASAAYLIGRDDDARRAWERAHHAWLADGEPERAARCAFWLVACIFGDADQALGAGWIGRGRRLLEGRGPCVERGYLLYPEAVAAIVGGDAARAHARFSEAADIGARFADADLVALARHGQGRALVHMGRPAEGMALLDEVMVALTSGEVSPIIVGDVYCSVIQACEELFDLSRARSWTAALGEWCDAQPDLVPFRGQCLLHRAEILQLEGAWGEAMGEAVRAAERLVDRPGTPSLGAALYRQAELHRLRGEGAAAEEGYRAASRAGREPQPGLALLRLDQGRAEAARAAIGRALEEAADPLDRSRLLPAGVEIALATGDTAAARAGADELARLASGLDAPMPRAVAAHCDGAVLLAEGDAHAALAALRAAWQGWRELGAPYEAARARVLLGAACARLGDADSAEMELDAARRAFEALGAAPDAARARPVPAQPPAPGGLTAREIEVLRLVATGGTNRAIAAELVLSEKTVARHLSNIFAKLGVPSRAAATAYAYEHGLVAGARAPRYP